MTGARSVEKRVLLTPREQNRVARLLRKASEAADCTITFSDITRAGLFLLLDHRDEFLGQLRKAGPWFRPQRGNKNSTVEFEEELTEIFRRVVRSRKAGRKS